MLHHSGRPPAVHLRPRPGRRYRWLRPGFAAAAPRNRRPVL